MHMARSWKKAEEGWALLGLLLALGVIGIVMLKMVPNIQTQVRRDKEAEMIYRGEHLAEAIARYYNRGIPGAVQLDVQPPYGYLYELKKLRDGVTFGINKIKFARPSAMLDGLSGQEWEPVRFRDPRLSFAIQAQATAKQVPIPPSYFKIAAAPTGITVGAPGELPQLQPVSPETETPRGQPGRSPQGAPTGQLGQRPQGGQTGRDPDDSDDNDDSDFDPLGHLLQPGQNLPIVAVAPRIKGASIRPLYGMKNYDEWVFIYLPSAQFRPNVRPNPNPNQPPPPPPRPNF